MVLSACRAVVAQLALLIRAFGCCMATLFEKEMDQQKKQEIAKKVLLQFAQYGFRKTSMADIAEVAGVSRQSIYKKFGTKEQCYDWTIDTYLQALYSEMFTLLERDDLPPMQVLAMVFDIFIGQTVETVSKPHGMELYRDSLRLTCGSDQDWPLRFKARLADFLLRHRFATEATATGLAFTLIYSGKGLLMEGGTREKINHDMGLIFATICS